MSKFPDASMASLICSVTTGSDVRFFISVVSGWVFVVVTVFPFTLVVVVVESVLVLSPLAFVVVVEPVLVEGSVPVVVPVLSATVDSSLILYTNEGSFLISSTSFGLFTISVSSCGSSSTSFAKSGGSYVLISSSSYGSTSEISTGAVVVLVSVDEPVAPGVVPVPLVVPVALLVVFESVAYPVVGSVVVVFVAVVGSGTTVDLM